MTKKILIIDSDVDMRDSLKALLEFEGYSVSTANDEFEGAKFIDTEPPPDLVVMNLMMERSPDANLQQEQGFRWSSMPIVVFSADGNIYLRKHRTGGDEHLKKPLTTEGILRAIDYCLA